MPIRGQRSIWPKKGSPPTGIFSTRGSQKMDDTGRFSHKVDLDYSKGSSTRSKPGSKSGQATRHLPPKKKVSGRMAHALGK